MTFVTPATLIENMKDSAVVLWVYHGEEGWHPKIFTSDAEAMKAIESGSVSSAFIATRPLQLCFSHVGHR